MCQLNFYAEFNFAALFFGCSRLAHFPGQAVSFLIRFLKTNRYSVPSECDFAKKCVQNQKLAVYFIDVLLDLSTVVCTKLTFRY